jgi:hypothetical protein
MKEGLEERLHLLNTLNSGLPPRIRVTSDHGPKEWNSAMNERYVMRDGPVTNRVRSLQAGGPEKR